MDNETISVGFEPAARAELLAMFTGMALQGILSNSGHAGLSTPVVASAAVAAADATVSALEAFHVAAAKEAEAKLRADKAAFDAAQVGPDDSAAQ